MRKNAKERRQTRNQVVVDEELKIDSFFKIVVVLLIILVIFAGITMWATRDKSEKEKTVIQYTKIVAGSILNRSEEDYYVLVEAKDDENTATYESLINKYVAKADSKRVYIVDLADPFNSNYIGEENVLSFENITDARFKESVLLHIVNNKISSSKFGESIKTYLTEKSA